MLTEVELNRATIDASYYSVAKTHTQGWPSENVVPPLPGG